MGKGRKQRIGYYQTPLDKAVQSSLKKKLIFYIITNTLIREVNPHCNLSDCVAAHVDSAG